MSSLLRRAGKRGRVGSHLLRIAPPGPVPVPPLATPALASPAAAAPPAQSLPRSPRLLLLPGSLTPLAGVSSFARRGSLPLCSVRGSFPPRPAGPGPQASAGVLALLAVNPLAFFGSAQQPGREISTDTVQGVENSASVDGASALDDAFSWEAENEGMVALPAEGVAIVDCMVSCVESILHRHSPTLVDGGESEDRDSKPSPRIPPEQLASELEEAWARRGLTGSDSVQSLHIAEALKRVNSSAAALALLHWARAAWGIEIDAQLITALIGALHRAKDAGAILAVDRTVEKVGAKLTEEHYWRMCVALFQLGRVRRALKIPDQMVAAGLPPTLSLYNNILFLLLGDGKNREAIPWFREMKEKGVPFGLVSFEGVLIACRKARQSNAAMAIFQEMELSGIQPSSGLLNTMIDLHLDDFQTDKALDVFVQMKEQGPPPTAVTYGLIVRGLLEQQRVAEAESVFAEMQSIDDIKLNKTGGLIARGAMLRVYAKAGDIPRAVECLRGMRELGMEPDWETCSVLLTALIKQRSFREADVLLDFLLKGSEDSLISPIALLVSSCQRTENADDLQSLWYLIVKASGPVANVLKQIFSTPSADETLARPSTETPSSSDAKLTVKESTDELADALASIMLEEKGKRRGKIACFELVNTLIAFLRHCHLDAAAVSAWESGIRARVFRDRVRFGQIQKYDHIDLRRVPEATAYVGCAWALKKVCAAGGAAEGRKLRIVLVETDRRGTENSVVKATVERLLESEGIAYETDARGDFIVGPVSLQQWWSKMRPEGVRLRNDHNSAEFKRMQEAFEQPTLFGTETEACDELRQALGV